MFAIREQRTPGNPGSIPLSVQSVFGGLSRPTCCGCESTFSLKGYMI